MVKKEKRVTKSKTIFDNYDYETTYNNNINNLSETFIESIFHLTRYKVSYSTKTIKSGNQFEVEIYPAFKFNCQLSECIKKKGETRKQQKDLNNKNSRKRLERLIHCNFGPGDLWVHCTFNPENLPEDLKGVQKISANYFRRINYQRKKKGLSNARYIYVIEQGEYGTERYHLHLIIDNLMDREVIEKLWKHGVVTIRTLNYYGDQNLIGICKYLTKDPETYKKTTFRIKGKREWGSSKGNLKQPVERKNKTAFSRKKVLDMVKHQDSISGILESKYKNYQFKNVEIRYNDFNGLFYIYARMQDKRKVKMRI